MTFEETNFEQYEYATPEISVRNALTPLTVWDRLNLISRQGKIRVSEQFMKLKDSSATLNKLNYVVDNTRTLEETYPWLFDFSNPESARKARFLAGSLQRAIFRYVENEVPIPETVNVMAMAHTNIPLTTSRDRLCELTAPSCYIHQSCSYAAIKGDRFVSSFEASSAAFFSYLLKPVMDELHEITNIPCASSKYYEEHHYTWMRSLARYINSAVIYTPIAKEVFFFTPPNNTKVPSAQWMTYKEFAKSFVKYAHLFFWISMEESGRPLSEEQLAEMNKQQPVVIRKLIASLEARLFEDLKVEFVTDREEMERAFTSCGGSCMGYDINRYYAQRNDSSLDRPTTLYLSNPDFCLAVVYRGSEIISRAVGNSREKEYGRIYGEKDAFKELMKTNHPDWRQPTMSPLIGMKFEGEVVEVGPEDTPCVVCPYIDLYSDGSGAASVLVEKKEPGEIAKVYVEELPSEEGYSDYFRVVTTEAYQEGVVPIGMSASDFHSLCEEEEQEGRVWSEYHEEYLDEDEAVWVDSENSWVNREYVVVLHDDTYELEDNAVYSEWHAAYLHADEASYSTVLEDYLLDDRCAYSEHHRTVLPDDSQYTVYSELMEDTLWSEADEVVQLADGDWAVKEHRCNQFLVVAENQDGEWVVAVEQSLEIDTKPHLYAVMKKYGYVSVSKSYSLKDFVDSYLEVVDKDEPFYVVPEYSNYACKWAYSPDGEEHNITTILNKHEEAGDDADHIMFYVDHPAYDYWIETEDLPELLKQFPTLENCIYAYKKNFKPVKVEIDEQWKTEVGLNQLSLGI